MFSNLYHCNAQEVIAKDNVMSPSEKARDDIRHTVLRILGGHGAVMVIGGTAAYYLPDGLKVQNPTANLGLFQDISWGFSVWLNRIVFTSDHGSQFFRLGSTGTDKIYQGYYSPILLGYSVFDEQWLRISPFLESGSRSISAQDGIVFRSTTVGGGVEVSKAIPLGYYETPKVRDITTTCLLTLSLRASYLADYYYQQSLWSGGFLSTRFNVGIGLQSDLLEEK
jgi:hypothetical protein